MSLNTSLERIILSLSVSLCLASPAIAKRIEVKGDEVKEVPTENVPVNTGKGEASKYFTKSNRAPAETSSSSDHYLALHFGGFITSESYVWGRDEKAEDVGKITGGVTYKTSEWVNSADLLLRADFQSYAVDEYKPVKMSIIFAAAFPDSSSRFPLYFGAGIGPGIFFKQAKTESPISLDYQLFGGLRFFDVFPGVGFFAESGIKNHFHLLSDGQFNSVFFALGTVFTF